MRIAIEQDREPILQYLRENVQECLYMYIDITNYGIASANMKVWYSKENDGFSMVAMKYYDSFQLYSHKKNCDFTELHQLLRDNPVSMISGRKDIIESLAGSFPDYMASYGIVFRIYPYSEPYESEYKLSCAVESDVLEIAELLCSYEGFGEHYTVDLLSEQLSERIRTGTGHSYIARNEQNELVAHVAAFAETKDIAVISGAVVAPAFRKTNVYDQMNYYMYSCMDKKDIYAFAVEKKMIYMQKMWGTDCGEYGKLVKKRCPFS